MYLISAGGRPVSPIKAKLTVVSPKEERVGLFDCFYLRARVKKGSLGGARARGRACGRARVLYIREGAELLNWAFLTLIFATYISFAKFS